MCHETDKRWWWTRRTDDVAADTGSRAVVVCSTDRMQYRDWLSTEIRRTNFGRRAFIVAGPTAWNSLPDYVRDPSLNDDILGDH